MNIGKLQTKDTNKAIQFAITGMHFDMYLSSPFLRKLYGRYFWYLGKNRATHIIAAYEGDTLAGVLLAEMKGRESKHYSAWRQFYVKIFDFLQNTFFKDSAGLYESTNAEMFAEFEESYSPDGEIVFLAANPDIKVKGIGSMLLAELERREKGKRIHLYTDDFCTYQFYEHKGFDRISERNIKIDFGNEQVELKCFLYSKIL